MVSTPTRVPAPGCDLESLRIFIESKFNHIENELRNITDYQYEYEDKMGQWQTRVDAYQSNQEQRMNISDGRLAVVEGTAQKAHDMLHEMEKFVLGMNVQTLKQRLEKFAADIEKAFNGVHQVESDLLNHVGLMGVTYNQQQQQIDKFKETTEFQNVLINWHTVTCTIS